VWRKNREFGKAVHLAIQNYYSGKPIDPTIAATTQFKSFLAFDADWAAKLEPIAVELAMADDAIDCGGCIDALFRSTKTGNYVVVDWKTTMEDDYGADTPCAEPFAHLMATKATKAVLQTNLYACMFERALSIGGGGGAQYTNNTTCYIVYLREGAQTYAITEAKRDPGMETFYIARENTVRMARAAAAAVFTPAAPPPSFFAQYAIGGAVVDDRRQVIQARWKHAQINLESYFVRAENTGHSAKVRETIDRMTNNIERAIKAGLDNIRAIQCDTPLPEPILANESLVFHGPTPIHRRFLSNVAEEVDDEL